MSKFPVYGMPRVDWTSNQRKVLDRVSPEVRRKLLEAAENEDEYYEQDERLQITQPNLDENRRLAEIATTAPRVPWNEFLADHFTWLPGEHLGIIGPTGQGKTTLLVNLVPLHPFVVIFATKPEDDTMDEFLRRGYLKMEYWQSIDADQYPKRVLWPDARKLSAASYQQKVFHDAFEKIYLEGGWTVVIDELWFIVNILKLGMDVKLFLLQSRALHISLVMATQRPAFVPLEVYDMSTHLFFFRDNDETNLKRISGIHKKSARVIREIVANLESHQVLYVNTRTGEMLRTRAPRVN